MKNSRKGSILALLIIIVAIVVGVGGYLIYKQNSPSTSNLGAAAASQALNAPSLVEAFNDSSFNQNRVAVVWQDNSSGTDGDQIFRETGSNGIWVLYANVPGNSNPITVYYDTGVTPGLTYNYKMRAANGQPSGYSAYSNTATVTVGASDLPIPTNVMSFNDSIAGSVSDTRIEVTWADSNTAGLTRFEVFRENGQSGIWVLYANVPANSYTDSFRYTDIAVNPGETYYYKVRSFMATPYSSYAGGYSQFSAVTAARIGSGDLSLNPPSNAVASWSPSGTTPRVKITWQDNSNNETGFQVLRTTTPDTSASWELYANVEANVTTYYDTGVTPGIKYYYEVRAENGQPGGYSTDSNIASIQVPTMSTAATTWTATATGGTDPATGIALNAINMTAHVTASTAYSGNVTLYFYNPANENQPAYYQYFRNVSFQAGVPQSFVTTAWVPPTSATYTMKLGVFDSTYTKNIYWANNLGTVAGL